MADGVASAIPLEDYYSKSGYLVFAHGETEKEITIDLIEKEEDAGDRENIFCVKISNPEPEGVKVTKKDKCYVEIIGDNGMKLILCLLALEKKLKGIEKVLEMLKVKEDKTWISQFK